MSSRSLDLLLGGSILLVLGSQAPDILICGIGYTWWSARRSSGFVALDAAARSAFVGGVLVRLALGFLFFASMPLFGGLGALEVLGSLLRTDARATVLGVFGAGALSLMEALFLGISVRLVGPWMR